MKPVFWDFQLIYGYDCLRAVITELFNHIIEVKIGDICSEPVDVLISQFVVLVLLK